MITLRVDEQGVTHDGGTFKNLGPSRLHLGSSAADLPLEVGDEVTVGPGMFVTATGQWTVLEDLTAPSLPQAREVEVTVPVSKSVQKRLAAQRPKEPHVAVETASGRTVFVETEPKIERWGLPEEGADATAANPPAAPKRPAKRPAKPAPTRKPTRKPAPKRKAEPVRPAFPKPSKKGGKRGRVKR